MVVDGQVEAVGHGLYRLAEPDVADTETIAMVASAIPKSLGCLMSALRVHDIGTQSPGPNGRATA